MVVYKNVQIQLVDLPPISRDYMETWLPQIVRNADALLMVVDVTDAGALEVVEFVCATLAEWKISPVPPGTATDPEDLPVGVVERPTLMLGAKYDDPDGEDTWAMIEELYGERWPRLAVSAFTGHNLEELRAALYALLGKIRVYTKAPGKKPDLTAPFTLPRGSTVSDVAATVHKDFAVRLKFARIWGKEKYDGQMVQRDYVVQEEDVIELHV
jgi:ribosome-interacting GTPase 1